MDTARLKAQPCLCNTSCDPERTVKKIVQGMSKMPNMVVLFAVRGNITRFKSCLLTSLGKL